MGAEDKGAGRLEAVSDGIIATLTILMVLGLKVPDGAAEGGLLGGVLAALAPKLATYTVSFAVIAITWMHHRALFDVVPRSSPALVGWNAHLMFWMSLIPVATDFLGSNPVLPAAVAWYGAVMLGAAIAFTLLWRHAARASAEARGSPAPIARREAAAGAVAGVCYAAAIASAFVAPWASLAVYALVPVVFLARAASHSHGEAAAPS